MKITKMLSSSFFGSFVTVGLILTAAGPATASPRAACDVLSLAEIRSLVGAQMAVFEAGSSPPTTRGDSTMSTCTYVMTDVDGHPANGLGAKFTLMWAPNAKLVQTQRLLHQAAHRGTWRERRRSGPGLDREPLEWKSR